MQLASLLAPDTAELVSGSSAIEISAITADSRQVRSGTLFAGLAGSKTDGAAFVPAAIANGAAAIVVDTKVSVSVPEHVALLRAPEPRLALARIAARFYPRQPRHVFAVTGTNGKTSIADFTRQILSELGFAAASLGTIGVVKPGGAVYGSLTTPDPVTLHQTLQSLADEGVTHLTIEASSHGLDQFRLDGVRLAAAAFNNLGRDHLDYHPTIEDYLAAKLQLFTRCLQPGQPAIINMDGARADDAIAAARKAGLQVLTTGNDGDFIRLLATTSTPAGQQLRIAHAGQDFEIPFDLIGTYQASNALVAAAFALAAGAAPADVFAAISKLRGVKGRLETVGRRKGGVAIVDYAHKPEALAACLDALRPFARNRLITIVGCGGDRDKGKRPIMGRIAAEKADIVIVTDDNPRSEDPATVRREVLAGAPSATEIGDRATAIAAAVQMLRDGDVLLVAGKGHETGQIVGATVLPFSDHDAIAAAIADEPYRPT